MPELFDVAITAIFAREFLEASIVIGQYRQVVIRNPDWEGPRKARALKEIWITSSVAALLAIIVVLCIGIPLAVKSQEFEDRPKAIIEGISKIVASIFIAQLSLKIPKWLQIYPVSAKEKQIGLTLHSLRFNVGWNIWREVAECGVFLLPFFLTGKGAIAIPISALVGITIGIASGLLFYIANTCTKSKLLLAIMMSFVTGWLSVGMFSGGTHEFEEVFGETKELFEFGKSDSFWGDKKLPLALFKPFGYSRHPSVLQVCTFWLWALVIVVAHFVQYKLALWKASRSEEEAQKDPKVDEACNLDNDPDSAKKSNEHATSDQEEPNAMSV